MTWDDMNDVERHETIKNMQRYGGGFAQCIGEAFDRADSFNLQRLVNTFPDFIEKFQPSNWSAQ